MFTKILHVKTVIISLGLSLTMAAGAIAQNGPQTMRANLYIIPSAGTRVLVDGNLTQYDNQYSNAVDIHDVWKMTNTGENFGILRDGYTLVMERRKVIMLNDSSFFRLWNLQQRNYQIEIINSNLNHSNLTAALFDRYTDTKTSLAMNDTTRISFSVDADPASSSSSRFSLVYTTVAVNSLPVFFSSVNSQVKGSGIMVNWKVAYETDVLYYTVERSTNAGTFTTIGSVPAINNGNSQSYSYFDDNPPRGNNIYRVKAEFRDGNYAYSTLTRTAASNFVEMVIYPNPVINRRVQIQLNGIDKGLYRVSFTNGNGKEVWTELTTLSAAAMKSVQLPSNIKSGIYRCTISNAGGFTETKTIIVL